jgi:hypothetical protein
LRCLGTGDGKSAMADDLDIYRSAKVIIDQYGDGAGDHAAKMSREMAAKDDTVAFTMWKLIQAAIDELQERMPAKDSTVH